MTDKAGYLICDRMDCQLNEKHRCFWIVETIVTKRGTINKINTETCPFYKLKVKKEEHK